MRHRYLFILEIDPVEVGRAYEELPSHLTLMSRFFSDLPSAKITESVLPLFKSKNLVEVKFGQTTKLGPKKLTVHMVSNTDHLKGLHNDLKHLLDSLHVEYEYPQFIGEGHKPHVTWRNGNNFHAGDNRIASAAYLIEVVDKKRVVRSKLSLKGNDL
ncbi:MAG TPA: 2'-5' RNA ligase family protein [Candidatus Saccharimonadales bacterium]|nr:2'-5' RNA ligase family protein [Candidatus Saccharimonadales bacterium]